MAQQARQPAVLLDPRYDQRRGLRCNRSEELGITEDIGIEIVHRMGEAIRRQVSTHRRQVLDPQATGGCQTGWSQASWEAFLESVSRLPKSGMTDARRFCLHPRTLTGRGRGHALSVTSNAVVGEGTLRHAQHESRCICMIKCVLAVVVVSYMTI